MADAACALIGNSIGANNVPIAKRFMKLITFIIGTIIILLSLITFLARQSIADLFTDDAELAALTTKVLIVAALVFLFDGLQGFL